MPAAKLPLEILDQVFGPLGFAGGQAEAKQFALFAEGVNQIAINGGR